MADKSTAIHDLMRGYEQFRAPLEALDDGAYGETWLGEWNLSQLLAHRAGWYREMTAASARTSRGERPTPARGREEEYGGRVDRGDRDRGPRRDRPRPDAR